MLNLSTNICFFLLFLEDDYNLHINQSINEQMPCFLLLQSNNDRIMWNS